MDHIFQSTLPISFNRYLFFFYVNYLYVRTNPAILLFVFFWLSLFFILIFFILGFFFPLAFYGLLEYLLELSLVLWFSYSVTWTLVELHFDLSVVSLALSIVFLNFSMVFYVAVFGGSSKYYVYKINHSLLVLSSYQFKWRVETMPPFMSLYPLPFLILLF